MGSVRRHLQLTLAVLKPDVTSHPHIAHIIQQMIRRNGFLFVRSKHLYLSQSRAEDFYREHHGKFFHNRLVSFMASGPISAHILADTNAIQKWRTLMGATKVFKTIHAEPDSIRGRFGLTDTRNSTHGSDSNETARRETNFFFPEFDIDSWYKTEEKYFHQGLVEFDAEFTEHRIIPPRKNNIQFLSDLQLSNCVP